MQRFIRNMSIFAVVFAVSGCLSEGENTVVPQDASTEAPVTVASAGSILSDPVVGEAFRGGRLNWSNNNGSMLYRYRAIERDGEIYVCGAFSGRGPSISRRFNREALRLAVVTAGGEVVLSNLRFFNEVSSGNLETDLVGSPTRCNTTGRAAGSIPLGSLQVEFRRDRYRLRR